MLRCGIGALTSRRSLLSLPAHRLIFAQERRCRIQAFWVGHWGWRDCIKYKLFLPCAGQILFKWLTYRQLLPPPVQSRHRIWAGHPYTHCLSGGFPPAGLWIWISNLFHLKEGHDKWATLIAKRCMSMLTFARPWNESPLNPLTLDSNIAPFPVTFSLVCPAIEPLPLLIFTGLSIKTF